MTDGREKTKLKILRNPAGLLWPNMAAPVCGFIAASFGFTALLGWTTGIQVLTAFGRGMIPMAPSTALLFMLFGLGIALYGIFPDNNSTKRILRIIISLCLASVFAILVLSSFNINLEAEHLGFRIGSDLNGIPVGHMSPLTAACFSLTGVSFLLLLYSSGNKIRLISAVLASIYPVLLVATVLATAYLFGGRILYNSGIIPPALTTSLSFIFLGSGMMRFSRQKLKSRGDNGNFQGLFFALIFILFCTVIITGGYFSFSNYKNNYEKAVETQLTIIADQKVSELVQWRKERKGDALIFYENEIFSDLVRQFVNNRQGTYAAKSLKTWLEKVQSRYAYDRVMLLDARGSLLLTIPESDEPADPHLVRDVPEILGSNKVAFLDFHRDNTNPPIHLAIAVPIQDEEANGAPLGVLVLRIDPEIYLYPLIKSWPTTSETAETLLVCREGDEVLYLNDLRFKKGSALNLMFPLTRKDLPAVQAVLGKTGIVEGKDYRGVPVIACVQSIPDSPWFIVARMDREEVFSALYERMWMMIALGGALIAGIAVAMSLTGRRQRLLAYEERCNAAEAARTAEMRYRETLDKMMEGCQIIGFDWRYLYINDAAARQGKKAKGELLGHTMMEAYPGIENTEMFAELKRCMADRSSKSLENEFLYPDGGRNFFELSVQPVPEGIFILSLDITERKKAENSLQESERRLASIYDTVGDVIFYVGVEADDTYRFVSVNKAFCRITGLSEEMIAGKLVNEVIPEPSLSMVLEKYRQAIRENSIVRWEEISDYPAGRIVGEVNVAPVVDDMNRCLYLVGSVHDITERKHAEEKERHLNSILRAIRNVNQLITKEKDKHSLIQKACEDLVATRGFSSSWIVILNESGIPVHSAQAMQKGSSFPLQEIFNRGELPLCAKNALTSLDIIVIRDVFEQCMGCSFARDNRGNAAFCVRLEKDSKVYGVLYASVPYAFADDVQEQSLFKEVGEDIAFALYNIDLEERREKAEKELRDSETRYRTLFESAAEGIFITEIETKKLLYANPAFCFMLGYLEDEIERLRVNDIHTKEVLERIESEFKANYRIAKSFKQQGVPFLKKDGTILYADIITTPNLSLNGASYSATFITDVTDRMKADEDKRKLQEQLWQSQKMEAIGRLSGGVAHDFNNMLTTIIGNSEVALMRLNKNQHGEEWKDLIEDIRFAGEKAAILTRQLLAFSRRQILKPEIINLNTIVSEMDKMLRRLIGEDIELVTILSPDLGMVEADPGQIEQIIMNLAVNARDAMPEGGKLTIESADIELDESYSSTHFPQKPGSYEMISITDTGMGMTKEVQEHAFEPFFTTKPKGKGTGLGLSIVYGIVKQSNGFIWVYSEEDKGTTFKIYLPRVEDEPDGQETIVKRTLTPACGSETILVVEDDAMIMKMIKKVLSRCGYTILCAKDGMEAVSVSELHQGAIHMILTDVIMPGMGGRELAKQVSETRPEIKVLFMSGYTDNAVVHHGVLEKGLNFIQKPFPSANLMKKIREVLDKLN
jgi:two-component system, cell cycle sensor histidine kinase and response regulator CckA